MGDLADDILTSFGLSDDDKKKYDVVKAKFERHFIKRRNKIYERAKFNQRRQLPGESVDDFITSLYGLVEYCEYGELCEEMIRDRIVVGLQDASLSEKLQLDPELTLQNAITKVQQYETVKKQQATVRGETTSVDGLSKRPYKERKPFVLCRTLVRPRMTLAPDVASHHPNLDSFVLPRMQRAISAKRKDTTKHFVSRGKRLTW